MAGYLFGRDGPCECRRRSGYTAAAIVLLLVYGTAAASFQEAFTPIHNFFQTAERDDLTGPCIPNPSQYTGKSISTLPCSDIVVELPFELAFDGSQIGVPDKVGTSTGMRMYMPSTNKAETYRSKLVVVQSSSDRLRVQSMTGTWEKTNNKLRNALGVGLPVPNNSLKLELTVKMPNTDSTGRERFCLWLAVSDQEFVWLCALRQSNGYRVYLYSEYGDVKETKTNINGVQLGTDREITLRMDVLPAQSEIEAFYQVTGDSRQQVNTISVNALTLNVDQAGTDPAVGSRTMGGFVSLRGSNQPSQKFFVTKFSVEVLLPPSDTGTGESQVDFNTHAVENIVEPTSMVWAGDKLWVANVLGGVYRVSFNADRTAATDITIFNPIGQRMLTGITSDPDFDVNKCLWLSHSSPSQSMGEANSGQVHRVCNLGEAGTSVTQVIYGLPRALANHATNNLFFKDGFLYVAIGGNTASGAPNNWNSITPFAFAERAEQYLSAGLVRFPVFDPAFNGDCTPSQSVTELDTTGITDKTPPSCSHEIYATGMRNVFDCVWHSNGKLYCPDNAIGGRGTFPELPTGYVFGDSCDGIIDVTTNTDNDPFVRHDALYMVNQGKYYGHPNPARYECVMEGGNPTSGKDFQAPVMPVVDGTTYGFHVKEYPVGVQPHTHYEKPIASFGKNRSPDGIIEYKSTKMCDKLRGQLLTTWFSVEPQVRRIELESDGTVKNDGTLRRSDLATGGSTLNKPLGIAEDEDGNLFVGEFAGNRVTVLNPKAASCSRRTTVAAAPVQLEGAASATDGRQLFAFGGRREAQATDEAHVYEAANDTWTSLPDLPEPLVDAAAVVDSDGRVLIVGGEKADGSMSARVWSFDPRTGEYVVHSTLPEGRAGALVELQDGIPLVVGGVTENGTPPTTGVLRLARVGTWEAAAQMSEPRAHAAGAVGPDGKLMVCGGRALRNGAHGVTRSCEQYDGAQWRSAVPMSEARSHHAVFAHGSKFVSKGGYTEDGSISDSIETLTPGHPTWLHVGKMRTGRSSAIHGALGGELYTFSGATKFDITRRGDAVHIN